MHEYAKYFSKPITLVKPLNFKGSEQSFQSIQSMGPNLFYNP